MHVFMAWCLWHGYDMLNARDRQLSFACRAPISGVRRYGRVVNKAALDLADRKHLASCNAVLAKVRLACPGWNRSRHPAAQSSCLVVLQLRKASGALPSTSVFRGPDLPIARGEVRLGHFDTTMCG